MNSSSGNQRTTREIQVVLPTPERLCGLIIQPRLDGASKVSLQQAVMELTLTVLLYLKIKSCLPQVMIMAFSVFITTHAELEMTMENTEDILNSLHVLNSLREINGYSLQVVKIRLAFNGRKNDYR